MRPDTGHRSAAQCYIDLHLPTIDLHLPTSWLVCVTQQCASTFPGTPTKVSVFGPKPSALGAAATPSPRHARAAARLHVGRPQRKVVAQQLHDQRAVLVRLLSQCVQLRDGFVEGLRSPPASTRTGALHAGRDARAGTAGRPTLPHNSTGAAQKTLL